MKIKAIKLYENGFMTQPFALGGEEGMENFDKNVKYRSSLQNYLIDTGEEVILIDTGMPAETPQTVPDENSMIFMGTKIASYVDALAKEGYKPEDVSKILVTHKHGDHTGELRAFPNAKVYVGPEDAEELNVPEENLVKATYSMALITISQHPRRLLMESIIFRQRDIPMEIVLSLQKVMDFSTCSMAM